MTTTEEFLQTLSKYPSADEVDAASNCAQNKATAYAKSLDLDAVVAVENGETYVTWNLEDEDGEFAANVQVEFDEAFSDEIAKMGYSI